MPVRSYLDGGLCYDRRNKVFVLFGGAIYKGNPRNDTWVYDTRKGKWWEMKPKTSPAPRGHHKLVWHDKLGVIVMFGGAGNAGRVFGDLWIYETAADRWTEIETKICPPPGQVAATYDAAHDLVIIYNPRGETWLLKLVK